MVMVGDAGDTPPHSAAVKFDENGTLLWEWQVRIVFTALGRAWECCWRTADEPYRMRWGLYIGNLRQDDGTSLWSRSNPDIGAFRVNT